MGFCVSKDCQRQEFDSVLSPSVDTKKIYSEIMKKFAPSKRLNEKRFSLPDNVDDFLFVPQLKAVVVFTGIWLKSEFNLRPSAIPSNETFYSPINTINASFSQSTSIHQFKLSNLGDSCSSFGPSFISELPLDPSAQPAILIYSLKRLKLISKINKFSFGFTFYSRVRYSTHLSGFLLLEVNLGIYYLSVAGRKLSKILLSYDKDIDTRTFEILDSLGYLAVSTKSSNQIKLYALSNEETRKSARAGIPVINISRTHVINLPNARSPISTLSFTPKNGIFIVGFKNRKYACYRWDVEAEDFETLTLAQYNQVGRSQSYELSRADNYQKNMSFLMGNRKAWVFEDKNCLYLWRFDSLPSEVNIWDTSFLGKGQLRLASKIDWSKFCDLPSRRGWNFISEAVQQASMINDNDTRALSLIALTFIKMDKGMISYDFIAKTEERLSIITLGNRNGRVYCQVSYL